MHLTSQSLTTLATPPGGRIFREEIGGINYGIQSLSGVCSSKITLWTEGTLKRSQRSRRTTLRTDDIASSSQDEIHFNAGLSRFLRNIIVMFKSNVYVWVIIKFYKFIKKIMFLNLLKIIRYLTKLFKIYPKYFK